MNLKSEQNLSMDELMERNRHPHMRQAEPEQATPPTPAELQVQEHHVVINWTMPESIERIECRMKTLEEQSDWQTEYLRRLCERPTAYATQAQMGELLKAVKHLEQMTEQAGKPKEKASWLRKLHLPKITFPTVEWPVVIMVLMMLAALVMIWLFLGKNLSGWMSLLR